MGDDKSIKMSRIERDRELLIPVVDINSNSNNVVVSPKPSSSSASSNLAGHEVNFSYFFGLNLFILGF